MDRQCTSATSISVSCKNVCTSTTRSRFQPAAGGNYAEAYAQWLYDDCRPRYQDWIKRHDELFTVASGVLSSYRTVEKLLKDVPEMGQFIPQCSAAYPVPAVPISNALTTFLLAGVEFKKVA